METKNFISVIITLAVGIILTVGVLIPVISDNSGNGGNGPAYTNTGEYYYKTPVDGETHTLKGVHNDFEIQILYDEEVLHTLTMGEEAWSLPMLSFIYNDHTYVMGYTYAPYVDGNALDDFIDTFMYDATENSSDYYQFDIEFTVHGNEVNLGSTDCICRFYLAPSGEYTYAESPIIENDTEYIISDTYGEFDLENLPHWHRYANFTGSGVGTEISGITAFPSEWSNNNWCEIESIQYTLDSETVEQGIKLNKVEIEATWEDSESTVTNYELTKFIVPVQVGEGNSSGEGMSPTLSAMLSVIPIIVIVGLIMGAISYFIRRQ